MRRAFFVSTLLLIGIRPVAAHDEFVVHYGMAGWSSTIVDSSFYGVAATADIQAGVIDEDTGTRSLGHFYNPQLMEAPFFSLGAGTAPDNSQTQWNEAVVEFLLGNYNGVDKAYHRLGRSMHLMQDMSSPPHVHDDAHPPTDPSDFESWGPSVFGGYDFSSVQPIFAAVRTAKGYAEEVANLTYEYSAYDVELDEQAGAQVSTEYSQMFPSLVFIDGGLFGDDRWEVDLVGCFDCVLGDDWWVDEYAKIEDNGGRGGTARIMGTAYIESSAGGTGGGDPVPEIFKGVDNTVAQKTLRELWAENSYPMAIGYGAGMMLDYLTEMMSFSCGNGVLDYGEECDDGGTVAGDCCSAICQFEQAGSICRASTGICDSEETCSGVSGTCPSDSLEPVGAACTDDGDVCTDDECDGLGTCLHTEDETNGAQCVSHVQTKPQQKCILKLNKSAGKVAKAQLRVSYDCIRDATEGLVADAQTCLSADADNRIAKAEAKTNKLFAKKCSGAALPDFGPTDSAIVNSDSQVEMRSLVGDAYGFDLNTAIAAGAGDETVGLCQAGVARSFDKGIKARLKAFQSCKKFGLRAPPSITKATELSLCLGAAILDEKNQVAKAFGRFSRTVDTRCQGVDLDAAFPGLCQGAADSAAFKQCIDNAIDCRYCSMLKGVDGFSADCDQLDDGVQNLSCL